MFVIVAPGFVAGLMPWWISRWQFQPAFFLAQSIRFVGGFLIGLGLVGLLDSVARFAIQGFGTPAPVYPTRKLIVTGLYRFVRNPMYIAVVAAILGQGLLLGNLELLEYGGLVWLLFHLFVLLCEEPTLRATFGRDYSVFCAVVPRWIPRLTPWKPT